MKGLSRRDSCIVFGMLLSVAMVLIRIFSPTANEIFRHALSLFIFLGIIYYNINGNSTIDENNINLKQLHTVKEEKEELIPKSSAEANEGKKLRTTRLYYLDNLKTMLTSFVVIAHIGIRYLGWLYAAYYNSFQLIWAAATLLQSFMICLFFFISGYFTPMSYNRKTKQKFLKDKFQRLGIPYLIWLLIIGPLVNIFLNKVIRNCSYSYHPDPQHCWFLAWLLVFNYCYAMMDEHLHQLTFKFPSNYLVLKLLTVGAILGMIQLMIVGIIGEFKDFIYMPIAVGSLPFHIFHFIFGIITYNSKWLTNDFKKISKCNIITIRTLWTFISLATFGVYFIFYYFNIGYSPMTDKNQNDDGTDCNYKENIHMHRNDRYMQWEILTQYILMYVILGAFSNIIIVGLMELTMSYLNFKNKFTIFLSKYAYVVYVIHPLIYYPILWTIMHLFHYFGGPKIIFCKDSLVSNTHFGNDGLVWLLCATTILLSLIIVWPVAWFVKQIPGAKYIL
eukprot:187900_1